MSSIAGIWRCCFHVFRIYRDETGGLGMALFNVVKYNGGPEVLAWKFPNEELGTWTQLIVNESQEAVLFKGGGKALDLLNQYLVN